MIGRGYVIWDASVDISVSWRFAPLTATDSGGQFTILSTTIIHPRRRRYRLAFYRGPQLVCHDLPRVISVRRRQLRVGVSAGPISLAFRPRPELSPFTAHLPSTLRAT